MTTFLLIYFETQCVDVHLFLFFSKNKKNCAPRIVLNNVENNKQNRNVEKLKTKWIANVIHSENIS